jgi:hypothetical protein
MPVSLLNLFFEKISFLRSDSSFAFFVQPFAQGIPKSSIHSMGIIVGCANLNEGCKVKEPSPLAGKIDTKNESTFQA